MTDLKNCLEDSTKTTANVVDEAESGNLNVTTELQNGGVVNGDTESLPLVLKSARPNSKLILRNMEEVLNSVKRKHRQKHRRKKEQKKLAQMEADATSNETNDEPQADKKSHKQPLQETKTSENGFINAKTNEKSFQSKSPLKNVATSAKNSSILEHFQRTPKKTAQNDPVDIFELSSARESESLILKQTEKPSKSTNAFEVMMNARNKSIGSNTPGKEAPVEIVDDNKATTAIAKRKLLLQEWAERKGGKKRKIDEEARAAYIEQQLESRTKRFKKMLVNGISPKPDDKPLEKSEKTKENHDIKNDKSLKENEKIYERPKRGRPRKRLLSSLDSKISEKSDVQDAETSEFLSKLSSPTKKKDSLLGYFKKKDSPKDVIKPVKVELKKTKEVTSHKNEQKNETPKRDRQPHVKETGMNSSISVPTELPPAAINNDPSSTPNSRPRRSCVGKARYDYDLEVSPIKSTKPMISSKATPTVNENTKANNTDACIIILDDSMTESPRKELKKLAPLFVRAVPKPSPDPIALKARRDFLNSGVPEKIRLEMEKQKLIEQHYEETYELFPKVNHVQQLTEDEMYFLKKEKLLQWELKSSDTFELPNVVSGKKLKAKQRSAIGTITNLTAKDFCPNITNKRENQWKILPLANGDKRAIVKSWKAGFDRFPTFKCYNQMREKYSFFSAIDSAQNTEQVTESFMVTRNSHNKSEIKKFNDSEGETEKPPIAAPNGELLFTEKYKPLVFEQVLVNLNPVIQLRDFLASWSNGYGGQNVRNSQGVDDDIDYVNDTSSSQMNCNTVVLLGPGSSGKTNAVFALAKDMNFNVLEINAGMKRTGKKLILELQEATQSHQVRQESSAVHSKSQQKLLKMPINGLKSKTKSLQNLECDSLSSADLSQSARKCLILIEDADIVIDQDAGFTDAIYTLAASSKRPVIVVASNPNCQHLQRLMQQNTINFSSPNVLNISKFLAVLSLIENCPVNLDDLISLYLYNRKDVRKTLLELQFFIQSGGDRTPSDISTQKTPTKDAENKKDGHFFASPTKRRFSVEPIIGQSTENDEKIDNETHKSRYIEKMYVHNKLFEFYTVGQNHELRIPFPVDFGLLRINLSSIFEVSNALKEGIDKSINISTSKNKYTKRKSRSPKKAWLNNARTTDVTQMTPLDSLCDFYENISIAALLGTIGNSDSNTAIQTPHFSDRLVPHLAEDISNELVQKSIDVNLAANMSPYNLFLTPIEKPRLSKHLHTIALRTKRSEALDYEPALRAICRSEKQRSLQERRSTRFYHYLRNTLLNDSNFSMAHFDSVCSILQTNEEVINEETTTE